MSFQTTKDSIYFTTILCALGMILVAPSAAQDFSNYTPEEKAAAAARQDKPSGKTADEDAQIRDVLNRVSAGDAAVVEATPADAGHSVAMIGTSSRYTLGSTDVIEVTVMRHPEVSGQFILNQEGKIQYEFVGDIVLAGLTKDEAEERLADKLSEYIIAPEVSIKIIGYNSKVVYVVGEVGAPGKIFMRGDTITVREALMQAGLPQLTGVTRKSRLITPSEKGDADIRKVDVYALLYEGDLRENFDMKPGDVIYIPATFLTKALRAIQPVAAPIGTAAGTGRTVTTGF